MRPARPADERAVAAFTAHTFSWGDYVARDWPEWLTDPRGRLFVADNSALANGVGGVNPTLTTQALATRTAEKIFEKYFGGEGWVGRESPVSSIDPQVTKAVRVANL